MKDIKDMNLRELANKLCDLHEGDTVGLLRIADRMDKLHDLTRWIPVSERMPTKEDGDSMGLVFVWHDTSSPLLKGHGYVAHYHWVPASDEGITHWKRITPPEDKP